jgi:hypothetical protein
MVIKMTYVLASVVQNLKLTFKPLFIFSKYSAVVILNIPCFDFLS